MREEETFTQTTERDTKTSGWFSWVGAEPSNMSRDTLSWALTRRGAERRARRKAKRFLSAQSYTTVIKL